MRLCLTCRTLSKRRAEFCAVCGRSFGGVRCRKGHRNAPGTQFCSTCGSNALSLPTRSLSLGFVPPLLAGLIVAPLLWFTLRWVIVHLLAYLGQHLPSPLLVFDRVLGYTLIYGGPLVFFYILISPLIPSAIKRAGKQTILWLLRTLFGGLFGRHKDKHSH